MSALHGIDLTARGRQIGSITLTQSDSRHGYGVIPVPIAVLSGGPGPTALLVAGTHGDEYEGQVLLHRLLHDTEADAVTGRLIVIPAANLPAVRDASRVSPLDGGNLNRSYPGSVDGGPTAQLAWAIADELLPHADYALDLHSGGTLSYYLPSAFVYADTDETRWAKKQHAAETLGLPWSIAVPARFETRSLSTACDDADVCMIATELGGGGMVAPHVVHQAYGGLHRLLSMWGLFEGAAATADPVKTRWVALDSKAALATPARGLFEPIAELGQWVRTGALLGRVHSIEELDRCAQPVYAHRDGVLAVVRRPPLVEPGDHLFSIATNLTEQSR